MSAGDPASGKLAEGAHLSPLGAHGKRNARAMRRYRTAISAPCAGPGVCFFRVFRNLAYFTRGTVRKRVPDQRLVARVWQAEARGASRGRHCRALRDSFEGARAGLPVPRALRRNAGDTRAIHAGRGRKSGTTGGSMRIRRAASGTAQERAALSSRPTEAAAVSAQVRTVVSASACASGDTSGVGSARRSAASCRH